MPERGFDYIIVGAGSAGCVLAERLSADPRCRVLLLEAGPPPRSPWIAIPAGLPRLLHGAGRYVRRDLSEPVPELDGRRLPLWHGRTLGGSGAINGMVYNRGHPRDFDGWRDAGNPGWGWDEVRPHFEAIERALRFSEPEVAQAIVERFVAAGVAMGLRRNDGLAGGQDGIGRYRLTIGDGRRCSPYDAFLQPARQRRNLRVLTGVEVQRILISEGRAAGIECRSRAGETVLRADRELIVCAGAIDTPRLLLVSGIGDAAALAACGIAPVHALPGVGQGFQDHPTVGFVAEVTPDMSLNRAIAGARQIAIGLRYLLTRRGLATIGGSVAGAFVRCDPAAERPDMQINFRPFSTAADAQGRIRAERAARITATIALLRPRSRGQIALDPAEPAGRPLIRPGYLAEPQDAARMIAGARLLARLFRTEPLASGIASARLVGDDGQSDAQILAAIQGSLATMAHPAGTCRMGADAGAVVDHRLRVRGIGALRIADCSIMPTLTSGNTNAPAMMIGARAAAMILADASAPGGG